MTTTLRRSFASLVFAVALAGCSKPVGQPVAVAGNPLTVNAGAVVRLDGSGSSDPNGRVLLYAWSFVSLPAGSQAVLHEPQSVTPSFVADVPGDYLVQLEVSNGLLASVPATVKITASQCGANPPTATVAVSVLPPFTSATAAAYAPGVGTTVQLTAAPSDADNSASCGGKQTFSFAWSLRDLPAGSLATLNNPASQNPFFSPDVVGTYVVEVVVTDSTGLKGVVDTPVSVSACQSGGVAQPAQVVAFTATQVLQSGTLTASSGAASNPQFVNNRPVELQAVVQDNIALADGTCQAVAPAGLSFSWSLARVPAGSRAALRNAGTVNPGFTPDVQGTYLLQLTSSDASGRSAITTFPVVTSSCGMAAPVAAAGLVSPVLVAGGPSVSASIPSGTTVQLDASASAGGDATNPQCPAAFAETLSYRWTFAALPTGSRVSLNNPLIVDPSFTPDADGIYVLGLVVSDGVLSSTATLTLTSSALANVAAQGVGPYSSIAIDPNNGGNPAIAIYDNPSGSLALIRCTANCTSNSPTWSAPVTIDTGLGTLTNGGGGNDARPVDLKITSGGYYVAYHFLSGGSCGVKVAASANGTGWAKTTIESQTNCNSSGTGNNESGRWLSLALKPGGSPVPAVAFYRANGAAGTNTVRYALCTDTPANCLGLGGASYALQDVQNATLALRQQGRWPSLRFTSTGNPRVAYYVTNDGTNQTSLGYAECNANCTTNPWVAGASNPVVDDGFGGANDVGRYASLDLVPVPGVTLDQPRIAYRDDSNGLLKYALCNGNCTGGLGSWSRQVLDSSGDPGRFASLALSPVTGDARIAYYDAANRELRYAYQTNLSLFRVAALDSSSTNVGLQCSLALSAQGNPRLSYFDAINLNEKYLAFGP